MALGRKPIEIVESGAHQLLIKSDTWQWVWLDQVADVKNGFAFKSKLFNHNLGMPLIRIRDITKTITENLYSGEYEEEYLVEKNEILIGMDGDFNCARWQGETGLLNQRVCKIDVTTKLYSDKFLYLCLQPYLNAINEETSSVTVKHLSSKTIQEIPLPLPPINEQHRIVAKIEELFSELDKGIESLKTAREQLKVYRQALLKHAFEGKLTEQWRKDNADDVQGGTSVAGARSARSARATKLESADDLLARIQQERETRYQQQLEDWKAAVKQWEAEGKVGKKPSKPKKNKDIENPTDIEIGGLFTLPKYWRWAKVGSISVVGTGVTPLKSRLDFYENGTIAWVTSGALNHSFVREPSKLVTEMALSETNLRLYPKKTLLLAMYGEGKTRGKCSELLIEAATNQAIAAIVQEASEEETRQYLKWFFFKNYIDIRRKSSGGVQPNLNLGIVENTILPVPPLKEMNVIVNDLERKISVIDEVAINISSEISKSEALRQSILKKAFSGQLVPQDPNDEPASVLLERIKAGKAEQDKQAKAKKTIKRKLKA